MGNDKTKICRSCGHYWTKGIKDGKHNRWCCHYGKPAVKAIGECTLKGTYKPRTNK